MSDTEDDYMSDKLLLKWYVLNFSSNMTKFILLFSDKDIRPGLVLNPSRKRQYEIEKKRQLEVKKPKSIKQLQKEQLEKGLSTAISSDNKGFQMLAKMGFKEGEGLGKSKSGRTEPIKIELKNEKLGLGVETHVKEKVKATISMKKQNLAKTLSDFQMNNKLKQAQRSLHKDIITAQRACEDLDLKHNVESPVQDFFWTRDTIKGKMNFENEEEEMNSIMNLVYILLKKTCVK